jgi:hypothetical protein
MEAGLSLSVLLFLLLMYLPGSALMSVSGRRSEEATVPACVYRGTLLLAATLGVFWILGELGKSDALARFVETLQAAVTGTGQVDLRAAGAIFLLCYVLAVCFGFLDLLRATGTSFLPGPARRLLAALARFRAVRAAGRCAGAIARAARRLGFRPPEPSCMPGSGDGLLETFVRFRRAGKRPYLAVVLRDGRKLEGECLRYAWNAREGVLLRGADDPRKVEWVRLDEAASVAFLNLASLEAEERSAAERDAWLEDVRKSRDILNGILPGYGDEVYGRILEEEKRRRGL